jgi:hypothetical protein
MSIFFIRHVCFSKSSCLLFELTFPQDIEQGKFEFGFKFHRKSKKRLPTLELMFLKFSIY